MEKDKQSLFVKKGLQASHDGIKKFKKKQFVKKEQAEDLAQMIAHLQLDQRQYLARAITLLESTAAKDRENQRQLMRHILKQTHDSIRIGVSGVPGAGKSTFIEAFGTMLCEQDYKVAVLAIDPSSSLTGGSVLGDKTRMEKLAAHPNAFIRPSPTSGTLGGVHRKTRETMLLCEAAGFDVILIETVGVGQSEIAVRNMVDCFMLLALTGAGDDLQGMKKGIMEIVDLIVVHKADGDNYANARKTMREYRRILHALQPATPDWETTALLVSSIENTGHDKVWQKIKDFKRLTTANGFFTNRRRAQLEHWFKEALEARLVEQFFLKEGKKAAVKDKQAAVLAGEISVTEAIDALID